MKQPKYKLEELKIFKGEDLEPYADIYRDILGIKLENVSTIPECIKAICEDSINKSLMENYIATGKVYTKDMFEISMTINLNTKDGSMTICTYVGYWDLDLERTTNIVPLNCYQEIKEYFFTELEKITTARMNLIKSKVA